jgi:hypothetical protein
MMNILSYEVSTGWGQSQSSSGPGEREILFTRSRPYKKNDQATIESKNNHLVRKYGFYYRYDTVEERAALNRLWALANDRFKPDSDQEADRLRHRPRRPPNPPLRQARHPLGPTARSEGALRGTGCRSHRPPRRRVCCTDR